MAAYDILGRFYDAIMGDQRESAMKIRKLIREYHPKAHALLELACGTGSYLQHLSNYYEVAGLDISSLMLSIARNKLPNVPLYQADMLRFQFDKSFDVIICMNDSINHLLKLRDWEKLFSTTSDHLYSNGIFIFDINTNQKLKNLSESPPLVHEFGKNFLITSVSYKKNKYEWHLRIFENAGRENYLLHEEILNEKAYSVKQIKKTLSKRFKKIQVFDLDNEQVTPKSKRLHFVAINK